MFSVLFLIEHKPVPGFQMQLYGSHFLGYVLACALYQPLAQVGGELRPGIVGDVDAASQRAAHVGGEDVYKRQPLNVVRLSAYAQKTRSRPP